MTHRVSGSQHERAPGEQQPGPPPASAEDWTSLSQLTDAQLYARGLRRWAAYDPADTIRPFARALGDLVQPDPNGATLVLWLLPREWYEAIPLGLSLVNIFWERGHFSPEGMSDEMRFGCLSYGVLVTRAVAGNAMKIDDQELDTLECGIDEASR